eukprot:gene11864-14970_t
MTIDNTFGATSFSRSVGFAAHRDRRDAAAGARASGPRHAELRPGRRQLVPAHEPAARRRADPGAPGPRRAPQRPAHERQSVIGSPAGKRATFEQAGKPPKPPSRPQSSKLPKGGSTSSIPDKWASFDNVGQPPKPPSRPQSSKLPKGGSTSAIPGMWASFDNVGQPPKPPSRPQSSKLSKGGSTSSIPARQREPPKAAPRERRARAARAERAAEARRAPATRARAASTRERIVPGSPRRIFVFVARRRVSIAVPLDHDDDATHNPGDMEVDEEEDRKSRLGEKQKALMKRFAARLQAVAATALADSKNRARDSPKMAMPRPSHKPPGAIPQPRRGGPDRKRLAAGRPRGRFWREIDGPSGVFIPRQPPGNNLFLTRGSLTAENYPTAPKISHAMTLVATGSPPHELCTPCIVPPPPFYVSTMRRRLDDRRCVKRADGQGRFEQDGAKPNGRGPHQPGRSPPPWGR